MTEFTRNTVITDSIEIGADVLKAGGLVVFPTETVYGLGADALDPDAVLGIFRAKGRPADNPLIVHISEISQLGPLVRDVPEAAKRLVEVFWPGPLTLILERSERIPDIITAGLDTVAIRMPSHPVARALIEQAGVPVAAPSANLSGSPSPTDESHVIEDLSGRVDVIIRGGRTAVGLESTVLDLTVKPPRILRPGFITREDLIDIIPDVEYDTHLIDPEATPRSPGMKYKHYAPQAQVMIVEGATPLPTILSIRERLEEAGDRVGILCETGLYDAIDGIRCDWGAGAAAQASRLFDCLRSLDNLGVDVILTHAVKKEKLGVAIMNRLEKAAGHFIIRTKEEPR